MSSSPLGPGGPLSGLRPGTPPASPGRRDLHLPQNTNVAPRHENAGYTCSMDSTTQGGALRYDFDPDPMKVVWGINAQVQTVPSRGGQVSYGTTRTIGPLIIAGLLRSRTDLLELASFVSEHMKEAIQLGAPLRFIYPERDFDFSLYVQTMSDIGLDSEQAEITPYMLTCAVTQDHTELTTVQLSELGIPANVGFIDIATAAAAAKQRIPAEYMPKTEE